MHVYLFKLKTTVLGGPTILQARVLFCDEKFFATKWFAEYP